MSLDPGSRETHAPHEDSKDTAEEVASYHLPTQAIPEDAPRSPIDNETKENLLGSVPEDISAIDPHTHEVEFTPFGEQTTAVTSPAETVVDDGQETTVATKRRPWGKIALAAGTGAAVIAAGVFAFGRNSDNNPDNPAPKPSATGPVKPGPTGEPTPSATATEQLSELEQQRALFEKLQIPASAISADQLRAYKDADPNALDLFIGVDGGTGLYPEVKDDLLNHKLAFGSMKAEDFLAAIERNEQVVTGTHLDVVDGKIVEVPNAKLMEDGQFRSVISKDLIMVNSDGLPSEAVAAAGTLADAGNGVVDIQIAAKMMAAEQRVAEYWVAHPEEDQKISQTNSAGVIASSFAQEKDLSSIDNRLSLARRLATGEISGIDGINYADSRIVGVHEQTFKTADGKTNTTVLGVSIVGKDQGTGELFAATVALLPATKTLGPDASSKKFVLEDAPKDSYNAFLIGKSSAN